MRTGIQAAAQMKRWHERGRTGVKGMCLKTCREAYRIGPRYPSAIVAWRHTPKKRKRKDFRTAPVGALHFYEGGRYGHVVIQSDTRRLVWGTDLPVGDRVGLHHRSLPITRWGYKYLGWTDFLNGVVVELKDKPIK